MTAPETRERAQPFGRVAGSSSHINYTCQVFGPGEATYTPSPQDYALGSFVGIEQPDGPMLVAIVYDTLLVNPEFGQMGPRLSPEEDLTIFSPDYLAEKVTLVSLLVVGSLSASGCAQGVPRVAARIDARVRPMGDDELEAFHHPGGRFALAYLPLLARTPHLLVPHIIENLLDDLASRFPDHAADISVVGQAVVWDTRIRSLG